MQGAAQKATKLIFENVSVETLKLECLGKSWNYKSVLVVYQELNYLSSVQNLRSGCFSMENLHLNTKDENNFKNLK